MHSTTYQRLCSGFYRSKQHRFESMRLLRAEEDFYESRCAAMDGGISSSVWFATDGVATLAKELRAARIEYYKFILRFYKRLRCQVARIRATSDRRASSQSLREAISRTRDQLDVAADTVDFYWDVVVY